MKKKLLGITLSTVFALTTLTGCGQNTGTDPSTSLESDLLSQIQETGVIKIGTEGTYAPYSYHDVSGDLVGYDVEVAEKIAEKLGVTAEFVETKWDAMIAGLDAKRFDIIVNQVGVSEERAEKYDFSDAYTFIHGALIVPADSEGIQTFADLNGKTSAQSLTSNWAQTAESYGATLVGVDGFDQSIELILSGRADATINADIALFDYLQQKPDAAVKIVELSEDVTVTAIPIRKGNETLHEAINQALAELAEEGVLTELSIKYFGTDISKQ